MIESAVQQLFLESNRENPFMPMDGQPTGTRFLIFICFLSDALGAYFFGKTYMCDVMKS